MKNVHLKTIALIIGSAGLLFSSCDKAEDTTDNNYCETYTTKVKIVTNVDHDITDLNGKVWHIKGTIEFDISLRGCTASFDVIVTDPDGNTHPFNDTVIIFLPDGNVVIGDAVYNPDELSGEYQVLVEIGREIIDEYNN